MSSKVKFLGSCMKSRMRAMYRNTEQDNIPLNEVGAIIKSSGFTTLDTFLLMEDGFTCFLTMSFLRRPLTYDNHPILSPIQRKASSVLHSYHSILFVTFINICFSFTKERPWSSKDRIGLSEEGEKRKKFSSETHYWWAK